MDRRELSTVLAALRYWQQEREYREDEIPSQIIDIATDGDSLDALSCEEIDELCARLNTSAVPILRKLSMCEDRTIEPLPIGSYYGDATIVDVVAYDPSDTYQPFYYRLSTGEYVWIPQNSPHVRLPKEDDA